MSCDTCLTTLLQASLLLACAVSAKLVLVGCMCCRLLLHSHLVLSLCTETMLLMQNNSFARFRTSRFFADFLAEYGDFGSSGGIGAGGGKSGGWTKSAVRRSVPGADGGQSVAEALSQASFRDKTRAGPLRSQPSHAALSPIQQQLQLQQQLAAMSPVTQTRAAPLPAALLRVASRRQTEDALVERSVQDSHGNS